MLDVFKIFVIYVDESSREFKHYNINVLTRYVITPSYNTSHLWQYNRYISCFIYHFV